MSQKLAKSTNFSGVSWIFSLSLLAFVCSFSVHLMNNVFLTSENPAALRDGISVITSDDASYIRPVFNFLDSGVWKGSSAGVGAYILRSPGYGMVLGTFVHILGQSNGLFAMVLFQLILWSFAVGNIPVFAQSLGFKKRPARWLGIFIAIMPMFYGFLSYTLTEALTPALVIFFYTFLLLGAKKNRNFLILSSIVLGFLILVRPALILLILSYLPLYHVSKSKLLPVLIISLLPILLWQVRVHRFTERFDLHPIYQTDATDLYRPLHETIWDFHKMTGQTGVEFHHSMNLLWQAAEGNIELSAATREVIGSLHPSVLHTFSEHELTSVYAKYVDVLRQQVPYQKANESINHSLVGEADLMTEFESMKKGYVANHFFRAWLVAPMGVVKDLVFHSNLSLYMFQNPLRGTVLMEVLRWISFLVHLFIYLFSLVFLFIRKNSLTISIGLPGILFFFYLIFIQRGVEERYMLPYLIPLFLLAVHTFTSFLPYRLKRLFLRIENKAQT